MVDWNERQSWQDSQRSQEHPCGELSHSLTEQLRHSDPGVRVDAARQLIALGKNGSDSAAQTAERLACLLHDEEHAVRITAAHGLIALRGDAVRPVIAALARDLQSTRLRGAVHHVLLALYERGCLNSAETLVLHALEGPDPAGHAARVIPAALHA